MCVEGGRGVGVGRGWLQHERAHKQGARCPIRLTGDGARRVWCKTRMAGACPEAVGYSIIAMEAMPSWHVLLHAEMPPGCRGHWMRFWAFPAPHALKHARRSQDDGTTDSLSNCHRHVAMRVLQQSCCHGDFAQRKTSGHARDKHPVATIGVVCSSARTGAVGAVDAVARGKSPRHYCRTARGADGTGRVELQHSAGCETVLLSSLRPCHASGASD